jgi:cbb3-type cytochrome oxidase subunit 3
MSLVRGVITLILFVLFVRLTIWAWSARRKPLFDAMARLPLEEGETAAITEPKEPKS